MQVKSEVFSRFGNSVDFFSGEPLSGVGDSTVGADLCVRPSSSERSLFCGRTRRSAPTQTTSTRQVQPSDAVTPVSVGTHDLCVRCRTSKTSFIVSTHYRTVVLMGTDALPLDTFVRPYRVSSRLVSSGRASVVPVSCWLLAVNSWLVLLCPYRSLHVITREPCGV